MYMYAEIKETVMKEMKFDVIYVVINYILHIYWCDLSKACSYILQGHGCFSTDKLGGKKMYVNHIN